MSVDRSNCISSLKFETEVDEFKALKNCFKCQKDFHLKCFRKDSKEIKTKKSKIICDGCENSIQSKMKNMRISDFFKPEKNASALTYNQNSCLNNKSKSGEAKLKLPKDLTSTQREILQKSLFRALEVKGIEFCDDLNYNDKECPPEKNDSSLEVGIQSISNFNKDIYYKFKIKSRKAEYAPLEIVDDEIQVIKKII